MKIVFLYFSILILIACSKSVDNNYNRDNCYFIFYECDNYDTEGEVDIYSTYSEVEGYGNKIATFIINFSYYYENNYCSYNDDCFDNYKNEFKLELLEDKHEYYFVFTNCFNRVYEKSITYNNEKYLNINFCK
jgi:hypothetical protein